MVLRRAYLTTWQATRYAPAVTRGSHGPWAWLVREWLMWRRILKLCVPLVLAAGLGLGAGEMLEFTWFQRVLWAVSLCLLVVWLFSIFSSEPYPVLSWPPFAAVVFALFATGIWLAFFVERTGGMRVTPGLDGGYGPAPRFLSAIICAFPALPYGVSAIVGLVSRVGG